MQACTGYTVMCILLYYIPSLEYNYICRLLLSGDSNLVAFHKQNRIRTALTGRALCLGSIIYNNI